MKMIRICYAILIALNVTVFVGCQPKPPTVDAVAAPVAAAPAPVKTVSVKLANWAETESIVKDNLGKVVVIDIWSTWCAPCVVEFPNLIKLHQQYGDKIVCVSLNCNYAGLATEPPESVQPEVEEFLKKQEATIENRICTETDEELLKTLGAASVPIVRVYDKHGKLRRQFDNDEGEYGEDGFRYDQHIVPLVEKLLRE
jgi:thiol-disulfide isomerase/thioredoxin